MFLNTNSNKKQFSILHIGWGFFPWRQGGLILYARDLMIRQKKDKHKVSYFFAGRKYPIKKQTTLKPWILKGINFYEIINSKISHRGDEGTLYPELNMSEPITENIFREVLKKVKPDIVHIHELAGLPSSLIEIIADEFKIPCIMTLADYFLLCPSLKLYNYVNQKHCQLSNVGNACLQCCIAAPKIMRNDIIETLKILNKNVEKKIGPIGKSIIKPMKGAFNFIYWKIKTKKRQKYNKNNVINGDIIAEKTRANLEVFYQKRRDINIKRLRKIDKLVARSKKVEEIYTKYIGENNSLIAINPYLSHIDSIKFRKIKNDINTVKFVTLNGFVSIQKGGELLLNSIACLNSEGYSSMYELYIYGGMSDLFIEKIAHYKNVFYMGTYKENKLDTILNGMHVGIVPSIWEEVFGYVGLELLAKGLPIISNPKGGITDYVINKVNGLINYSNTEEGFVAIMKEFIDNKNLIYDLNKNIAEMWDRNYEGHYWNIMKAYKDLLELK